MNLIPRSFFLDDVFDSFEGRRSLEMKCDIYDDGDSYVVEMDAPGISKDDINVDFHKGYLTISYEHDNSNNEEEKNYIRRERVYSSAKRQFYVGEVEEESIKATFKDGVLKVVVPKKEEISNKKTIEIE